MTVTTLKLDAASTAALIALRREIHHRDPRWIEPLHATVHAQLAPAHPFFTHSGNRHRRFAVMRGGRMAGHALAHVNAALRDTDGQAIGSIGFFECIDDYALAADLFGAAVDWLRREGGVGRIWAPLDFDIWGSHRLMVRGFEQRPFFGEPCNPPYYPDYFQRFGFTVRKRWTSLEVADRATIDEVIARHAAKHSALLAAGYRVRRIDPAQVSDMRALHAAEMASFAGLTGFTPCPFAQYERIFRTYASVMDLRFVSFLIAPDGAVAAFSIAYPDIAEPVRAMRGRTNWLARLRFLLRRHTQRVVYHSIGVPPAFRAGRGLGDALVHATLASVLAAGFDTVVFALIADDSPGRGVIGPAVERAQREYALFQLDL